MFYILLVNACFGQDVDATKLIVHYDFRFMSDTTQRNSFYQEKMLLFVGKNMSLYTGYDTYIYDSTVSARLSEIIATEQRVSPRAGLRLLNPLATKIIKNNSTKSVYTIETFYKNFQKEERFPVIDWVISSDTKVVAGLLCQKASASIFGRHYNAWFSTELKFSNGPWKLGGLPGLILEANDNKGEVYFACTGFSLPSPKTPLIRIPSMSIVTKPDEYSKLKQAFLEDPISFFENTPGLVSGSMSGGSKKINSSNFSRTKNKLQNNTLELSITSTKKPQ